MSTGKLLFTLPPEASIPSLEQVLARLSSIGLIKDGETTDPAVYLAGERFLQLITFLGCSPFVRLAPEDRNDTQYTHIRISGPYPSPQFRHGRNTPSPRCPACRNKQTEWLDMISRWASSNLATSCTGCGEKLAPDTLDWRQSAGVGMLFIEIWGVFPGEAVPSQTLLSALSDLGGDWVHFYVQE